jgi:hypothetical protein
MAGVEIGAAALAAQAARILHLVRAAWPSPANVEPLSIDLLYT